MYFFFIVLYVFKTVATTFVTSLPTTRGSMSCDFARVFPQRKKPIISLLEKRQKLKKRKKQRALNRKLRYSGKTG